MGSGSLGQNKILTIVDYNVGNVCSVTKAFEILGAEVVISNKKADIRSADHLVLSGVGAFSDGIKNLKKLGLINLLNKEVLENKKPILGICLGMQLMARDSEEFGLHKGLGWLDASVKKFELKDKGLKIPHMGWNNVKVNKKCFLFRGIKQDSEFYFVHSFHMVCDSAKEIVATCDYGIRFVAAIQKNNIFATQFHPEKSQTVGLKILENFLNLKR